MAPHRPDSKPGRVSDSRPAVHQSRRARPAPPERRQDEEAPAEAPLDPATRRRLASLVEQYELTTAAQGQLAFLLGLQAVDVTASTTVRGPAEALERHVADSLVALSLPPVAGSRVIADLGSGAGWPGLALAAALPGAQVTLVESAIRHCRYLERAIAGSGMTNVSAVHARAESWRPGFDEHDLVTARALAALPIVLEYAAPLLRVGGHAVAWKGLLDSEEAADGLAAAAELGLEHVETRDVSVGLDARDRVLVVYEKRAPTPQRFPRREGMAVKRPLGRRAKS